MNVDFSTKCCRGANLGSWVSSGSCVQSAVANDPAVLGAARLNGELEEGELSSPRVMLVQSGLLLGCSGLRAFPETEN